MDIVGLFSQNSTLTIFVISYCLVFIVGLAIRPMFGPDLDSDAYKNPPKNETDQSVDSGFFFLTDSRSSDLGF